jgi:hypothetical protein
MRETVGKDVTCRPDTVFNSYRLFLTVLQCRCNSKLSLQSGKLVPVKNDVSEQHNCKRLLHYSLGKSTLTEHFFVLSVVNI